MSDTTPPDATEVLNQADKIPVKYQSLRNRRPQITAKHQIELHAKKMEEASVVIPASTLKKFPVDSIDTNKSNPTIDKKRIPEHLLDGSLIGDTELPSGSDKIRKNYHSLRRRRPKIDGEHKTVHELPGAALNVATELTSRSDKKHNTYQSLRTRRPEIDVEHKIVHQVENEGRNLPVTPVSSRKIPSSSTIDSPILYPTSGKALPQHKTKSIDKRKG